jgi:signal peptidase I
VVIPFKGQQVSLDFKTVELYKEIIELYEGNSLEVKNSKVYVNGRETKRYTIQQNYYFVMDDNRDNAKDSRYWGFLPQSYIIGKANRILFSFNKNENKVRWNRIFKSL